MKRLTLLVGSAFIALMLAACGQGADKKADSSSQDMQQEQQAVPAEQTAPAEPAAPAAPTGTENTNQ